MKRIRFILLSVLVVLTSNLAINAGSEAHGRIDFYGHSVNVIYDQGFHKLKLNNLSQSEFSSLLNSYRNTNLKRTIELFKRDFDFYDLDDVGVSIMMDKFTQQMFGSQKKNEQTFIKYLLLKELGYDVLLTRTNDQLNCMGNLSFTPGRYIYITYNNKVYKDLDFTNRKNKGKHLIFIDRKRTYKTIIRNVIKTPKINALTKQKELSFRFQDSTYTVQAVSNQSILNFLNDLPMYNLGNEYTKLRLSSEMNRTLMPFLRAETQRMDKVEAATFLLSFVQQVVPYGSDYDKYGEERFYYPEETIMATTADCEDKAFLLAYLSKNLLNLDAVALYFEYDEHLALAINIPNYNSSYSFKYNNLRYVACEPTAKSAKLGYSNFKLSRVTKVIPL